MEKINPIFFKNRVEWRDWLKKNHEKEKQLWLGYYKKHSSQTGILYEEAVEEAICFGWIDGKVKRIDEQRFMQRYTPRREKSVWSKINKERAEKMIKKKKMTRAGWAKIEQAQKSGQWHRAYTSKKKLALPSDLKRSLMKNKKAWDNFHKFANSYQNMYIGWVAAAKREKTRRRRVKEIVKRAAQNQKPGVY